MVVHRRSVTLSNTNITLEKICETTHNNSSDKRKITKKAFGRDNKQMSIEVNTRTNNKKKDAHHTYYNILPPVDNIIHQKYDIGTKFLVIESVKTNKEDELNLEIGDEIELMGYSDQKQPFGKIIKDEIDIFGYFSFNHVQDIDSIAMGSRNRAFSSNIIRHNNSLEPTKTSDPTNNCSNLIELDKNKIKHRRSTTSIQSKLNLFQIVNKYIKNKGSFDSSSSSCKIIENENNQRRPSQIVIKKSEITKMDSNDHIQPSSCQLSEKCDQSSLSIEQFQSNTDNSNRDLMKPQKNIFITLFIERRTTFERITLHLDEPSFLKISSPFIQNNWYQT